MFLCAPIVKTDQLNSLIEQNKDVFKSLKAHLNFMKNDISESDVKSATEPETRVKRTVHRTVTQKFREVLRTSQTIQTEFKNAV